MIRKNTDTNEFRKLKVNTEMNVICGNIAQKREVNFSNSFKKCVE